MARFLVFLVAIALAVYALSDLAGSDEQRRGNIPKAVWTILVVFLPVVGPVAWLLVGRVQAPPAPPGRSGPLAPDDDPDFLWRLDQQRRSQDQGHSEPGHADDTGATDGPGAR